MLHLCGVGCKKWSRVEYFTKITIETTGTTRGTWQSMKWAVRPLNVCVEVDCIVYVVDYRDILPDYGAARWWLAGWLGYLLLNYGRLGIFVLICTRELHGVAMTDTSCTWGRRGRVSG